MSPGIGFSSSTTLPAPGTVIFDAESVELGDSIARGIPEVGVPTEPAGLAGVGCSLADWGKLFVALGVD